MSSRSESDSVEQIRIALFTVLANLGPPRRSVYVDDGHGSVRVPTAPSGAVTDACDFDVFGNRSLTAFVKFG
jgi:hypothetical protein